jgi:hypothetical protein
MGVYEGRGQLGKSLKELLARWAETRREWDDAVSASFEEKYLVPLERDLGTATAAMDHAAQVLSQARRDCGD